MLEFPFLYIERHKSEMSKHLITKNLWLFEKRFIPESGHIGGYTKVDQKAKDTLD